MYNIILTNVVWCAKNFSDFNTGLNKSGYAEITQLYIRIGLIAGEQQVLRFEVEVGDVSLVQVEEALEDLSHGTSSLELAQALVRVQDTLQLTASGTTHTTPSVTT